MLVLGTGLALERHVSEGQKDGRRRVGPPHLSRISWIVSSGRVRYGCQERSVLAIWATTKCAMSGCSGADARSRSLPLSPVENVERSPERTLSFIPCRPWLCERCPDWVRSCEDGLALSVAVHFRAGPFVGPTVSFTPEEHNTGSCRSLVCLRCLNCECCARSLVGWASESCK